MIKFLCISAILFISSFSLAAEESKSLVSVDDINSSVKISAELEKKYPVKEWKTIGFCDFKKKPLMTIKVPKILGWDPKCEYHTVKDGVEYCGPGDSSPRLTAVVNLNGQRRVLQVGMEAGEHKRAQYFPMSPVYFNEFKESESLLSTKVIMLEGHPAYLAEVEDQHGKLQRQIKSQTLIEFSYPNFGGRLYFIEGEEAPSSGQRGYVSHNRRVFQWAIDKMIESFKFKINIEDASGESALKTKKAK